METINYYSILKFLRRTFKSIALLLLLFSLNKLGYAQKKQEPLTRILFLFDASQSMFGTWQSGMKIDIAKKLLAELLDSLRNVDNIELAFRVYGHQKPYPPKDCDDSRLEVPFAKNNIDRIKSRLMSLVPKGTTPIARSLEACAKDFPNMPARNIVILITDGIEECDGDPCAVSQALQKKGIILKPFVVGIGMGKSYLETFNCIGKYYDASDEKTFKTMLGVIISQALNTSTVQINLLDIYDKPTETNVNMTFYDKKSGFIKYNFVHTMNQRGNPDTLKIDPLITYKIVVHTIPPVEKDSITLTPGKHTTIGIDVPQGTLLPKFEGDYKDLVCIVRKEGEVNTLNVQRFNTPIKYLVGKYDLEVLCLPRIYVKGVNISQSHTTTVQIPQPGFVTFISNTSGYGSLYTEENNYLQWVYNLEGSNNETLILQPGTYRVVYRPKDSVESVYTVVKTFKVISGSSITVNLY